MRPLTVFVLLIIVVGAGVLYRGDLNVIIQATQLSFGGKNVTGTNKK